MPQQIIKVSGSARGDYYKESDYVLTNLLYSKQVIYGKLPIIYRLYNGENHSLIKEVGGNAIPNYIFKGKDNNLPQQYKTELRPTIDPVTGEPVMRADNTRLAVYSNQRIAIPNDWDNAPMVANIGPETSISRMCGSGVIHSTVYEKPQLQRRGKYKDDQGGMANSYFLVGGFGGQNLPQNADPATILGVWNNFLTTARQYGLNSSEASAKALYFYSHGSAGKKITTLAELAQAFPRYFQFEKQLEMEFMSSLGGSSTTNKRFIDGKWYTVEQGYIGLWEKFKQTGLSDSAINQELLGMGYTSEQINAIRAVKGLTMYDLQRLSTGDGSSTPGSGGSSGGSSGGGRKSDGTTYKGPEGFRAGDVSEVTVNRSLNIFFGSDQFVDALSKDKSRKRIIDGSVPIMYQVYLDGTTDAEVGTPKINEFQFDLAPQDIQYSNFGGDWVSIERTGGFPFIDWKSFKLLQVSFSFVIAHKSVPGQVADGLDVPITQQLEELQRMAQTPFPVMFFGFDSFMTNQFRYDNSGTPRGIQFVIQDLNIAAVRRNSKMEITRAQANITLQEIPIEKTRLIGMPRLKHKPKTPDEEIPETDPEYNLWTKTMSQTPDRQLAVVTVQE